MSVVQESVSVENNSRQLGKAFAKFAADLKVALKAGSSLSEAISVAQAALVDIVPVLPNFNGVAADLADSQQFEANAAYLSGWDIYNAFKS